jgi:hypothetical protein
MKHEWVTKTQCSQCLGVRTPENAADERCSGMILNRHTDNAYERARGIVRREDGALPKEALVHGTYYYGRCRNASIARWDAVKQVFVHWRQKFGAIFREEIKCREDELHFDVFDPFYELEQSVGLNPISVSEPPPKAD